ncbi:hypothetical protein SAMN04488580_104105 [Mycobacterium sp. 283mftsu]|nr:hypothetical protein MMUC44124_27100 [Mycolicibacterium mucogenicum DSM 44124]SEA72615.1 hypothetical protein SAMN04488580_104105 [Mycobacterium sp. 283mftsu]
MMFDSTRSLVLASTAMLALGFSTAVAAADPPGPGTPCGQDKVITSINTCEPLNASCTGYDGMLIGRVAADGRCVIPGLDGTRW